MFVDDNLIISSTQKMCRRVVNAFRELYDVHANSSRDCFLGDQIDWVQENELSTTRSLKLSHPLYIESILRRFRIEDCKPVATLMVESFWKGIDDEKSTKPVDEPLYQQMVGSLLLLDLHTRLDILSSVIVLARFQKAPAAYHKAAKRVLRYLRGTTKFGIRYFRTNIEVNGFVNGDFAGDQKDRKPMSGYIVTLASAPCIWTSEKQGTAALSTCEAKYHSMVSATKELVWIKRVINKAGWSLRCATTLWSIIQSPIQWAIGERCPSSRAKHIDVHVPITRNLVKGKVIDVK